MIPLFIGGTGRSGTTVTLEYLGKHSKVYASNPLELRVLTETGGLLDLFETKNLELFKELFVKKWSFGTNQTIGLSSSIALQQLNIAVNSLDASAQSIQNFYTNIFRLQKGFKENAFYLGDSTPSTVRYAHRIIEVFPKSRFLHLFRDGRDSAYSIYKMRDFFSVKNNKSEFDCLEWWYERVLQSFLSVGKLSSDAYLNVRFEDFILNPREEYRSKVFGFLGLDQDQETKDYFLNQISPDKVSIGEWKSLKTWKEFDLRYSMILKDLEKQGIFIEKAY